MVCSPLALKLTFIVAFTGPCRVLAAAKESSTSHCFLNQYNPPGLSSDLGTETSDIFMNDMHHILGLDGNDTEWVSLLSELEASLRPMLVAIPKNAYGNFGHVGVRYALHRLFLQRYGWSFRGLEPDSQGWNSTSPTLILKGKVDADVQKAFDARLDSTGLTLQEMAFLAAVIKTMTHQETRARLMTVFQASGISPFYSLDAESVNTILELYMASHILSLDLKKMPMQEVMTEVANIDYIYPVWKETQEFMTEKRVKIAAGRPKLGLADIETLVQDIEDNFGQVQNLECQFLKGKLIALQEGVSGRVPLAQFYQAAISGEQWQFSESTSYLRQLGALDDSEPEHLRVILANWVNSRSNCVASSASYSVCCYNECDNLLGRLEQSLQAPDGTPSEIAALVAALASPSAAAGRQLQAGLLQRLDQIAEGTGGRVRLHGRLFAQWMHHAYPLECAFPHVSGTTVPLSPVDYAVEAEQEFAATEEEMLQFIASAKANAAKRAHLEAAFFDELTAWQHVEEYFVPWSVEIPTVRDAEPWTPLQLVAAAATFSVIVSIAIVLGTTDYSKAAPATTYSV